MFPEASALRTLHWDELHSEEERSPVATDRRAGGKEERPAPETAQTNADGAGPERRHGGEYPRNGIGEKVYDSP